MNAKHEANFKYAQRNGYTGTIREYMEQAYAGYCKICARCNAEPMTFEQWQAV